MFGTMIVGYLTDNLRIKKMKAYILIAMMIVSFNSSAADIGKDKYMHVVATTAISTAFKFYGYSETESFWGGVIAGATKEAASYVFLNVKPDLGDMVANTIGAYIGSKSNFEFTIVRTPFETRKQISYTWIF